MTDETVIQKRNWFRYFPEGSIEFNAILRVLAVLLLIALMIVGGTQRPTVLVALAAILWADAVLLIWWFVQTSTDLDMLADPPVPRNPRAVFLVAMLPSLVAALLLAPWPAMFFPMRATRSLVQAVGLPLLGFAYIVTVLLAQRALQRIRLARPCWTLLLHIPLAHWFAGHRIARAIDARIRQRAPQSGSTPPGTAPSGGLIFADVLLAIVALCWIVAALSGAHSTPLTRIMYTAGHVGGILFGALFAVVNVAMIERVQQAFVALLRKL